MRWSIPKMNRHTDLEAEQNNAFNDILKAASIHSVYQPIVSLDDGRLFGYEALTRGPEQSVFRSPLKLFEFAQDCGKLYELDRLARHKAISGCTGLGANKKIFINIPASIIRDPEFSPGETYKLLRSCGLDATNVVFEITERSSIENFATAKKILEHYRKQGYQIAIDDAGAGYSSLEAIAELQPDFIKVDRSLVHGMHCNKVKAYILETFITFATKMNINVIAEGIELREDLEALQRMGIHYGQGYLLGRPHAELQPVEEEVVRMVVETGRKVTLARSTHDIGKLAVPTPSFPVDASISDIALFFRMNESEQGIVLLNKDEEVEGLMMRENLFQDLAGQYGVSLFWNKPVQHLMGKQPLILEESVGLERAAQLAMGREKRKIYDFLIVTRQGRLVGTVSIRSILESMAAIQIEAARVASPLTGLPGNMQIQREISQSWLFRESFAVIYADLNHFKWYNDTYGFQKGDAFIQYLANVLREVSAELGEPEDFVGHIGGDDFVLLTSGDPEVQCREVIRRFEQHAAPFYDGKDIHYVLDREGNRVKSPGVTVSLSVVLCRPFEGMNLDLIAQVAADVKKKAKSIGGSAYYINELDESEPEVIEHVSM